MQKPQSKEDCKRAIRLLRDLAAWGEHTGGWEAPVWRRLEKFLTYLTNRDSPQTTRKL